MSTYRTLRTAAGSAAIIAAVAVLAACEQDGRAHAHADAFPHEDGDPIVRADTFPMGQADRFDQPVPTKLLFGQPVMTAKDYMPVALADIREPLPPAVPLPSAKDVEAASSSTEGRSDGGAVNPAAGQAAAISDGQGEGGKHELGAPQ